MAARLEFHLISRNLGRTGRTCDKSNENERTGNASGLMMAMDGSSHHHRVVGSGTRYSMPVTCQHHVTIYSAVDQ